MAAKTPRRFREDIEKARRQVELMIGVLERHSVERDWGLGLQFKSAAADLKALLEQNTVPSEYRVAVVGRFKVGKSAFVNELLSQRLAGEDTNPETAAVTTFRHGSLVKATIRFIPKKTWTELKSLFKTNPGDPDAQRVKAWYALESKESKSPSGAERERFDLASLESQYLKEGGHAVDVVLNSALGKKGESEFRRRVKEFTSGTRPHHCLIESIEITAPSAILKEGVVIIDTPGVDDTERFRVALTEKAVENVDAVLFLTKSGASYSQSEKEFLLSLLRKGNVKQLIFVVTQVDQTYEQHVRQSRDQDEAAEPIEARIAKEKARLLAEIDSTLDELSRDSDDVATLRYREQFANVIVAFTSAANHRDVQQGDPIKYPIHPNDAGGIKQVQHTLFETLSTESRLAVTARNIELGARTILESQLRLLDSRRGAIKRLKNKEVAEKALDTFRAKFGEASDEFSTAVDADVTLFSKNLEQHNAFASMAIENIALNAEKVLADYETSDAGRHWRTRRSGYWGYMRDLQSRVANKIFPSVENLLNVYTDELNSYVEKFKVHLNSLSADASRIADDLDLEAEITFDLGARLTDVLEEILGEIQSNIEGEEQRISHFLDEFVTEEVEERISRAREGVTSILGRGTAWRQTDEVRRFYAEVKSILTDALKRHVDSRRVDFLKTLESVAINLPERALSEARAELKLTQESIRAAAHSALHGRKEAFERLATEVQTSIADTMRKAEQVFVIEDLAAAESATPGDPARDMKVEGSILASPLSGFQAATVEDSGEVRYEIDWVKSVKAAATQLMSRIELLEGKQNWSWQKIFQSQFLKGSKRVLVVDPHLSSPHQMRNLRELVSRIRDAASLEELHVLTGPEEKGSAGDDPQLRGFAESLANDANIQFHWDRDRTNHDRFLILDNGAVFKLGRGLDIYKPALGLAKNDSSLRKVRKCEIDVFGPQGEWAPD